MVFSRHETPESMVAGERPALRRDSSGYPGADATADFDVWREDFTWESVVAAREVSESFLLHRCRGAERSGCDASGATELARGSERVGGGVLCLFERALSSLRLWESAMGNAGGSPETGSRLFGDSVIGLSGQQDRFWVEGLEVQGQEGIEILGVPVRQGVQEFFDGP